LERILPTGDLAFKKVLASEAHKEILCGFIRDFFDIEVTPQEITIENPYSIAAYKDFIKGEEVTELSPTVKDIAASFKIADFVSELQIRKNHYYDERALYYPFERFCQNYSKVGFMKTTADGRPIRYSSLRPIYSLNILGYEHFKGDNDALRIFELYDPKRNKKFKELLKIGFFELVKSNIETENQNHWRDYFTIGEVNVEAPEYIKKASQIIELVNLTEEERKMASALEKYQVIRDAEIVSSFLDGEENKAIEIAKNLIRLKIAFEDISMATGLNMSVLKDLKEKIDTQDK
jgi:hypothetical protein